MHYKSATRAQDSMPSSHPITLARMVLFVICCLPVFASAQHSHGVLTPSVTFPQDDAVLLEQPRMLTMSFRVDVRLLKLALYTDEGEWLNMGFQYDPSQSEHNFVFPMPSELPPAKYYTVEWSVVDERQRFMQGKFNFAFGPDAIPPSETIAASYTMPDLELKNEKGEYLTPFEVYQRRQAEREQQSGN